MMTFLIVPFLITMDLTLDQPTILVGLVMGNTLMVMTILMRLIIVLARIIVGLPAAGVTQIHPHRIYFIISYLLVIMMLLIQ